MYIIFSFTLLMIVLAVREGEWPTFLETLKGNSYNLIKHKTILESSMSPLEDLPKVRNHGRTDSPVRVGFSAAPNLDSPPSIARDFLEDDGEDEIILPNAILSSSGTSGQQVLETDNGQMNCPKSIGGYKVVGVIGRGGMGSVLRVQNPFFDFEQALKIINNRIDSSEARHQFIKEMRTQASLDHTNIAKVHYAGIHKIKGEARHQLYFVMTLEAGGDLGEAIRKRGPYPSEQAANIVRRLARAIALAHTKGIYHCDLKPKNVLLDAEGVPKVTDFGLVKLLVDTQKWGGDRAKPFGTPGYMPLEQAEGLYERVDARSDVYGLGAILYELLTGRAPYQGANTDEILGQVKNKEPDAIRKINPTVPARLVSICQKCLAKDPAARFQSAEELEAELETYIRPHWAIRYWKRIVLVMIMLAMMFGLIWSVSDRVKADTAAKSRLKAEGDLEKKRDEEAVFKPFSDARQVVLHAASDFDSRIRNQSIDSLNSLIAEFPEWMKNWGKAKENLETANVPEIGLLWAKALTMRAEILIHQREYDKAIADLSEAEKYLPTDQCDTREEFGLAFANIDHLRGEALTDQQDWVKAEESFRKGLKRRESFFRTNPASKELKRDVALSYAWLGDAQLRLHYIPDALASYESASRHREELANASDSQIEDKCLHSRDKGNSASCHEWQGKMAAAIADWQLRILYYSTHVPRLAYPVLPEKFLCDRIGSASHLAELLLDQPENKTISQNNKIANRADLIAEIRRLLDDVETELLLAADPTLLTANSLQMAIVGGSVGPMRRHLLHPTMRHDLLSLKVKLHLSRARLFLLSNRANYQTIYLDSARSELRIADECLSLLDLKDKANATDSYAGAQVMALRAELAATPDVRREYLILSEDRLQKAFRKGFNMRAQIESNLAFEGVRTDLEFAFRFKSLIEKYLPEKLPASKPMSQEVGK